MPFQYKPKGRSTRKKISKKEFENAIQEIKNGASLRKTAIKYGIDRSTLRRYKINEYKLQVLDDKGSQYKNAQMFTISEEKILVNYLLISSKMNYGLTRNEAMKLTVQYATSNSKKNPNSWLQNGVTGKDWFRGFLTRNPEISLRTPEATSLSRATSFNKKKVTDFFQNLKSVREKYHFEPQNIYNCDETGCTTVQKCPKVLAAKKDRQVGQATSAERGTLVTVCFAVNAIGNVIPPFFIFPRVKYREEFVVNGPDGSDGDSYPSGWMTTKSFMKFMEHFKKHSHASKDNPVLLILDNHESHVSVEVIDFAKENGITMLTLPPHCSNKLQPLDIAVYSSLKSRYNTAMTNWMISNPGKTITIYNIPSFIKTIMSQTFSQSNISSGFKSSGIHPFNPDIFGEEEFMCSAVTDRENNDEAQDTSSRCSTSKVELGFNTPVEDSTSKITGDSDTPLQQRHHKQSASGISIIDLDDSALAGCQQGPDDANLTTDVTLPATRPTTPQTSSVPLISNQKTPSNTSFSPTPSTSAGAGQIITVTPEMIRPYPKAGPRKATRGRQPGKTKILTETPEKNDEGESLSNTKSLKQDLKTNDKIKENKSNKTKRRVLQDSDSDNNVPMRQTKTKAKSAPKKRKLNNKKNTKKHTKCAQKGKKKKESDSESENEHIIPYADTSDDDIDGTNEYGNNLDTRWYCFVCESEAVMDMRLCNSCKRYVHEVCVGLTDKDVEHFTCHECL